MDWSQTGNIRGLQGEQGIAGPPTYVTMQPEPPDPPIDGQFWYDTDAGLLQFWNGSDWIQAAGLADAPTDGSIYGRLDGTWVQAVTKAIYDAFVAAQDSRDDAQDAAIAAINWSTLSGKPATFPPTLPIAQSGVTGLVADQAAQDSAIALKAPLASPGLTGAPTAPTASPGTNSTQLATTAFVAAALATTGASVGTSAPPTSLGKFWWHPTEKTLRIWDGTAWEVVFATWAV